MNGKSVIRSKTVILCCGGFEASSQLRAQYLGPNWDLAHVRGSPYNTGDGLDFAARDVNAKFTGSPAVTLSAGMQTVQHTKAIEC